MKAIVVGAGLSGLVAARELTAAGVDVTVLDKGRSVGGRLATRRIGAAKLDHGAQFFTVRTPAFQRRVDDWLERGVVGVWSHGFGAAHSVGVPSATGGDANAVPPGDGHPRYVGLDGMNAIAKDLRHGLVVETETMAFAVRAGGKSAPGRWQVAIDDGTSRWADAVVLTCPLPQSFALLVDTGIDLDETLFRTEYDRTIALLATLDGPGAVPPPGGVQDADDVFSFIADNHAKGISAMSAITFHANPTWSETHWDHDEHALAALAAAATPWLGRSAIVDCQLKKWRFATPRTVWPEPCWIAGDSTIVLAGDAFAGPRIEGAHNSGLAAAHALIG
jgi:predicted NAD/FAD-dependent oxidoreductase